MSRALLVFFVVFGLAAWLVVAARTEHNRPIPPPANTNTTPSANLNTPVNAAPDAPIPAPGGLTLTRVSATDILIRWQPTQITNQSITYRIWRDGTLIAAIPQTQFLDVGVPATARPKYGISVLANSGQYSTTTEATAPAAPAPVATNTATPPSTPTTTTNTPTKTPTKTNTNTAPPPAPAATCGNGGPCSAAQVAAHNSRNNCWVYLSPPDRVYNITTYVRNGSLHPGGDVIAPYCGQNIYGPFTAGVGGHRHSGNAMALLGGYYVGPFQP